MARFRLHEPQRLKLLPLVGLAWAAFYFLVFHPLKDRAEALDKPLDAEWRKLVTALQETNASRVNFASIDARLRDTQESLIALQTVERKVMSRVDFGDELYAKMRAPFQLVDYQNERQRVLAELGRLSGQQQVPLGPAVTNGIPEYTADLRAPSLLWAELAFIRHLLATAINCKVSSIHVLSVPVASIDAQATNLASRLTEIPMQVELTGTTLSVARLLQSLPLRAEEIKAEGLPEAATNKPALFIDRLLLRRQSPHQPDEVRLSLRAAGFAFRE